MNRNYISKYGVILASDHDPLSDDRDELTEPMNELCDLSSELHITPKSTSDDTTDEEQEQDQDQEYIGKKPMNLNLNLVSCYNDEPFISLNINNVVITFDLGMGKKFKVYRNLRSLLENKENNEYNEYEFIIESTTSQLHVLEDANEKTWISINNKSKKSYNIEFMCDVPIRSLYDQLNADLLSDDKNKSCKLLSIIDTKFKPYSVWNMYNCQESTYIAPDKSIRDLDNDLDSDE